MAMAQNRSESVKVKTLWDISCAVVKEKIPITVDRLCVLPIPLIEELAVLLPWSDLLKLEDVLKNDDVTEKAWHCRYEELPQYKHDETKQQGCSHCRDEPDFPLSFRDRWLASCMSSYLLQTFFKWKVYPTESSADLSLCLWEDVGFLGNNPHLSFSEFNSIFMKMAEQVKKISIRLNALGQLYQHLQLFTALSTSLLELRVDFLSLVRSETWVQVLKELMQKGHLRSLHLINLGSSFVDWLLLFFIVSGMFHCRPCAQHFSASMRLAPSTSGRMSQSGVITYGAKATTIVPDAESSDDDYVQPSDESPTPLYSLAGSNLEDTIQIQDGAISTRICHARISTLQHNLSECFSSGLCSDFLKVLKNFGYTGLTGEDDSLKTISIEKGEDKLSCAGKSPRMTTTSISMEHCDLLDEALGVSSGPLTHRSPTVTVREANISLMESLSRLHMEEGHASRGIEHLSASWNSTDLHFPKDDTFVGMHEALGCFAPGWSSLSSISVDLGTLESNAWYLFEALLSPIRAGSLQSVALYSSVEDWHSTCRFFWETLNILSGSDCHNSSNTKRTHPMRLLKIDSFPVKEIGVDSFPLENLHDLWSADQDNGDSKGQPAATDAAEMGVTDRSSFPGLQELYLKFVAFKGVGAFFPLGHFIRKDRALRHISLYECFLDDASINLLLKALNSGAHTSLTCIDLYASLRSMSDNQWQELCQILQRSPSLTCLSLARCRLRGEHIKHADFVNAVRSHGTKRKLTLDLSANRLGNSVWDFMAQTVHPDSSLKELRFQGTGSRAGRGLSAMERIIQDHSPHLPLLRSCTWSCAQHDPHADSASSALRQISQTVVIPGNMEEDFLAMM